MPLDDRLRQAGRAGGVEDPERVVERDLLEFQLAPSPAASSSCQVIAPVELREVGLRGRGRGGRRCAPGSASRPGARRRPRCGRNPCRRSGSRRRRRGPWARSARSGRRRSRRRSRASSSTRWRRGWRWRERRRASRGCWACRRRRGRRGRRPARGAPRRRAATWSPQLAPGELAELPQLRGVADGDLGVVAVAEDVLGVVELGAGNQSAPGIAWSRRTSE